MLKRTGRRTVWSVAFFATMALLAACTGGEEKEGSRSSLTLVNRPIVDMVPAASIGKDSQPVDPAFVFAPETPLITVVAQVGEVTGSPLDFTWSQVTDEGEQGLFTHTVEVASFQAAYSVGESPGTLTPGTYRVQATLEGESRSTQFEVAAPEDAEATGPAEGVAGQGATSGPPSSGDSGAVGPPVDPAAGLSETALFTAVNWAPVDPNASTIQVIVVAGVPGGGGRVEVKATMGGNTRTVSLPTDEAGLVGKTLGFDPCVHPGGSDLPGTKATFETTLYEGDTVAASNTDFTTLGPDATPPVLEVTSDPPPGSRVEPGQTITVSIVGREAREGTWQTGVKQIKLTDFDTGAVLEEHVFGEEALPCAQKAWSKGLDVVYTVPEDAPPEIHLMAEAFDFAEERGSFGLSYFTGEVWEGTVASTITTVPASAGGLCPNPTFTEGTVRLVVATDGSVTGTYDVTGCGVSQPHAEFTGTVNDAGFLFPQLVVFTNGSLIPKVSPTQAEATLTNLQGPAVTWVTTWNLTCKSCEA